MELKKRIVDYVSMLDQRYGNKYRDYHVKWGRKYAKIVMRSYSQSSVHTFVDLNNGNVLKAATWAGPDLNNPRSNVNDNDCGLSGVTEYGAVYLK